jgi:hypothetical protein
MPRSSRQKQNLKSISILSRMEDSRPGILPAGR